MTNWKETTLDKVIDLVIDHRGLTPKKLGGDWSRVGYRAISAKSIKNGQLVSEDQMNILPESLYKKWMKEEVEYGDIFLTSEAPLGEHIIWKSEEKLVLSQRIFGIRTKNGIFDPFFFNYFIDSKYYQHQLKSRESGSTVTGIKQSELLKTKIFLPPIEEQKEIAGVLSSLDDKIELLREENKTLEATAQAIFKEWFVNFNFPDAEGKPYKSSGGKMIDSELGNIPEGWRVGKLNEVLDLQGGFVHDTKISGKSISKIAKMGVVDGKSLFNRNSVIDYSGEIDKKYKLEEDDLIICTRDMTQDRVVIGNISIVPQDLAISGLYAGSNTWIIKSDLNKFFLFLLFREDSFRQHIIQSSKGTTIVMITRDSFLNCDIIIPSSKFIDYIMECLLPIFKKIKNINSEIQTLSTLRDTLLPKLMSGDVKINLHERK